MEGKKISFGFMKTKKQEKLEVTEKREYIDCVEEKSIKVIGGESIKEDVPLVIPMKPNTIVTAERLKEIAEKVESVLEEPVPIKTEQGIDEGPPVNETLEQMAARELLQEAKQKKVIEQPTLMVPLQTKPIMDGQKESTLHDYESVPIQEFGMAMLRGMGWTPGQEQSKYKQPQLRPKGLGLGADKVLTENQKKTASKEKDDELAIVKGSFVKVTAGKYNGCYGKVVSLDEDNGRVMIDIAMKETISLSEFMMQAVTKSEYVKQSKVLNADSYTQYKKNENESNKHSKEQNTSNRQSTSSLKMNEGDKETRERERRKIERYKDTRDDDKYSNGNNKEKNERVVSHRSRNNSSSDEVSYRSTRKNKKEYSSHESLSSDSNRKDHRKKKRYSSDSSSDSSEADYRRKHKSKSSKSSKEKRDIDKKRKGKKKKRDRDRSPNYRKHKK